MKRKNFFPMTVWILALALFAAGCGSNSYREVEEQKSGDGGGSFYDPDTGGGDTGDDDDGQNTGGLGIPPEEYSWQKSGDGKNDSAAYTVETDDILKVRVTAGDGSISVSGTSSAGTQYPLNYSCMEVRVSLNGGPAKTSGVLKRGTGHQRIYVPGCTPSFYGYNAWYGYSAQFGWYDSNCISQMEVDCCSTAPSYKILNFSGEAQNLIGISKKIKVTAAYVPRVQGCTVQPLYQNTTAKTAHVVNGELKIQTNMTDGF